MATILVFFCLLANWPSLPRLRENILLNFEFKNEATRANLQENKGILKWRLFWNKVNSSILDYFFVLMNTTTMIPYAISGSGTRERGQQCGRKIPAIFKREWTALKC